MYVKKNNQVIRKSLNTSQDLSQLMKKYIQYDKEKPHSIFLLDVETQTDML